MSNTGTKLAWKRYVEENSDDIYEMFDKILGDNLLGCFLDYDKDMNIAMITNVKKYNESEFEKLCDFLRLIKVSGDIFSHEKLEEDGSFAVVVVLLPHGLSLRYVNETRWLIADHLARENIWEDEDNSVDLIGKQFGQLLATELSDDENDPYVDDLSDTNELPFVE